MSLAAQKCSTSYLRRSAAPVARGACRPVLPARVPRAALRHAAVVVRAAEAEVTEVPLGLKAKAEAADASDGFIPVCLPEELPKGVRKEVEIDGKQVLLFWYRNQIYAIQARSPAEGAYSEGFIKAKFTQDYCIECPSTGSLFSINDGSVKSWYPNNAMLRAITPPDTIKPMEIYPVKLTQEALMVDVSRSAIAAPRTDRGGAGTSLENNNVFTVQPNVYFEGMDPSKEQASKYQVGPAAVGVQAGAMSFASVLGIGALSVVLTALAVYAIGFQ